MAERRIVTPWPASVRASDVKSHQFASADVAQILAGKCAWLYEWATGAPTQTTDSPQTPRNPQGRYGHDHSGPPYGSAIRHNLYSRSALGSTKWQIGTGSNVRQISIIPEDQSTAKVRCEFAVRAFPSWIENTPYSRGFLHLLVSCTVVATSISVTISGQTTQTRTYNFGSQTANALKMLSNSALYADIVPGWNVIDVEVNVTDPGTKNTVYLHALSFAQRTNRNH